MLKKSKLKKIVATSIMALMMVGAIDSGILGMRNIYVHAATSEATKVQQNLRMPVSKNVINEVINRTAKGVLDTHFSMDWTAIGLDRANNGKDIPSDYLDKIAKHLKDNENKVLSPTEYERMTLGILAAGGDPTNVQGTGINLIKKIANADLNAQGVNALVFALIALDSKNYEIPENSKWDRVKIIDQIINKQIEKDGGWTFFGDKGDPDMTGMAMTALSRYNNDTYPKVQKAIKRGVEFLHNVQIKEGKNIGGFESWGTINSESCAQAIMGLCTNGIDPAGDEFTCNNSGDKGNIVSALLNFEVKSSGKFAHEVDGDKNGMATEQALYALDQYKFYLEGKGSIYDWAKNPSSTIK